MAATESDVKAINGSTLTDPEIAPFLSAAVCVIENVDKCLTAKGVTDACKDKATAWLAAHMMAMTAVAAGTNVNKRETFENYTVERAISNFSGSGVVSTTYGQTANMLTAGCLKDADKAPAQVLFFG